MHLWHLWHKGSKTEEAIMGRSREDPWSCDRSCDTWQVSKKQALQLIVATSAKEKELELVKSWRPPRACGVPWSAGWSDEEWNWKHQTGTSGASGASGTFPYFSHIYEVDVFFPDFHGHVSIVRQISPSTISIWRIGNRLVGKLPKLTSARV